MVGSKKLDIDGGVLLMRKNEPDPYGLKSNFPDYIILKVLGNGE